jgi:hypothetical protein
VIQLLRKTRPASKIIAITGKPGAKNNLDIAKHLGAHDTLLKPSASKSCSMRCHLN